jgi:large subunit ribosomal protein L6
MSNIGKQRILIPKTVTVKSLGWKLSAEGKYGKALIVLPHHTKILIKDNYLSLISPFIDSSLYGSLQKKVKALIQGLALEYVTYLQLVGVGYKARIEKNQLILRLGFSHEVEICIPKDLNLSLFKRNNIRISGSDYGKVRQFAHKVRAFRRPEPFKGKGILVIGENLRRKEGKKKNI